MSFVSIAMLLGLMAVPWITMVIVCKRFAGTTAFVLVTVISFAVLSNAIMAQWWIHNEYLEQQIALLDRDGDGFWSAADKATWTEQDQQMMAAYIGDGGRKVFVFYVAPVLSLLYSTGVALSGGFIRR